MAITVIGGVLLTTFLTLLVIPVVYSVLDRKTYPVHDAERVAPTVAQPATS
jgi:HAE1 family hydrophobic/amphiphilic exporter-1